VKRTALIFLTAIYLLSCIGLGVDRFYCCGKLASVTLAYAGADHTDKNNCCKHERKTFKVKDSHYSVGSFSLVHPVPAIIPLVITITSEIIANQFHAKIVYKGDAPPGNPDIPIYTLNCAYRI
jgi:hypothetical protein